MKRNILISITIIFSSLYVFGQDSSKVSIEINTNYVYYFLFSPNHNSYYPKPINSFNYGQSIIFSNQLTNQLKVGVGLNYSTKNAYSKSNDYIYNNYLIEREGFNIKYIKLIFLTSIKMIDLKKFNINIINGLFINFISKYDYTRYYSNKTNEKINDPNSSMYGSATLRNGIVFARLINPRLLFKVSSFIDFRFIGEVPEEDKKNYQYVGNLPADIFSIGICIGIEYLFTKS